ncbi:hypothetical protein W02_42400 [Nitrospira sp. KM1]|uniref:PilZ domain-containing protein n=1 Tax=Nitrospira sp. KM1 TaxID=1936990 RepID=UPI0013A72AE8|nr:PilZ domain-containing protein [Nitrospira sp. KM1]BCA57100.1 hypothetical protein W02_42400 [Nitrospira sp. KM1]
MAKRIRPRVFVHRQVEYRYARGEGKGVLTDLSLSGCRIKGPIHFVPGMRIRLKLWLPDAIDPIDVEQANVRWTGGEYFGVSFPLLAESMKMRLSKVVEVLREAQEEDVAVISVPAFESTAKRS